MVIAFANNQTLVALDAVPVTIFTDPVSLEGYDRGTGNLMVHSFWAQGGVVKALTYTAQVSNDGTNWVDSGLSSNKGGSPRQRWVELDAAAAEEEHGDERARAVEAIGASGDGP
jgi:hypothetical protein